jgi:trehalose/maltose transport system permease protein
VDGAGPIRRFTSITLPMLIPALLVALIFRTLDALRVFDAIFVLTGTNPETMSMSIYARQQLVDFSDIGYGSAISTGIFLIIAIFTVGYLSVLRTEGDS